MNFWKTNLVAEIVARIFAPRPNETIWQFAERAVFFDAMQAPEPGPYRASKTPWAKRLQELVQNPFHNGHRIRKIVLMKSSQTGFTEAVLNCIRWFVRYSPRNVIYAIDSRDEAGNISDRLTPTLKSLGEDIFTGDDDDEKRFVLKLRHMKIWFFGSFSAGKFANKQAAFNVCDEYEEHGRIAGDTTSLANLESRMKRSREGRRSDP
jgi:phage terminase large subunit GpA-like protein